MIDSIVFIVSDSIIPLVKIIYFTNYLIHFLIIFIVFDSYDIV